MILSIDPGQSIGYALWHEVPDEDSPVLHTSGKIGSKANAMIKAQKLESPDLIWRAHSLSLLDQFERLIFSLEERTYDMTNIDHVYIEQPLFIGGAVGRAVASKGDLVKLTLVAGAIWGVINCARPNAQVHWVPVEEWKGQLKKDTVIKRLKRVCGWEGIGYDNVKTDHEWDAIGIGLHAQGLFERGIPQERKDG